MGAVREETRCGVQDNPPFPTLLHRRGQKQASGTIPYQDAPELRERGISLPKAEQSKTLLCVIRSQETQQRLRASPKDLNAFPSVATVRAARFPNRCLLSRVHCIPNNPSVAAKPSQYRHHSPGRMERNTRIGAEVKFRLLLTARRREQNNSQRKRPARVPAPCRQQAGRRRLGRRSAWNTYEQLASF
ncbi:hypothetical protein OBBRIDRAFT_406941 [Obba rivulosa]|uniref:Uncharacterized protein n=1 Tax=Obba rivulosa TaxID=1052685 RepID=A0A8E2DG43_9APHY|nr:hypothetical protein OBBRIDRAFT_406941 [Obba rivulosa]